MVVGAGRSWESFRGSCQLGALGWALGTRKSLRAYREALSRSMGVGRRLGSTFRKRSLGRCPWSRPTGRRFDHFADGIKLMGDHGSLSERSYWVISMRIGWWEWEPSVDHWVLFQARCRRAMPSPSAGPDYWESLREAVGWAHHILPWEGYRGSFRKDYGGRDGSHWGLFFRRSRTESGGSRLGKSVTYPSPNS